MMWLRCIKVEDVAGQILASLGTSNKSVISASAVPLEAAPFEPSQRTLKLSSFPWFTLIEIHRHLLSCHCASYIHSLVEDTLIRHSNCPPGAGSAADTKETNAHQCGPSEDVAGLAPVALGEYKGGKERDSQMSHLSAWSRYGLWKAQSSYNMKYWNCRPS